MRWAQRGDAPGDWGGGGATVGGGGRQRLEGGLWLHGALTTWTMCRGKDWGRGSGGGGTDVEGWYRENHNQESAFFQTLFSQCTSKLDWKTFAPQNHSFFALFPVPASPKLDLFCFGPISLVEIYFLWPQAHVLYFHMLFTCYICYITCCIATYNW